MEHYLALRAITAGDQAVETALLELLPYAQIAIEQATARGEWDEARRLIGLVERTDAGFPALARLRDRLVAAEAEAARADAAAALAAAEALKADQERLAAAERERGPATQALAAAPSPAAAAPASRPPSPPATTAQASPEPAPARAATPTSVAVREPVPTPIPDLLEAPQPRYPLMALRRKLEGEVVLELRIEANGSVGQARVLSATPPGMFDEAAVAATERWRFAAGQAAVTTRQVMRFRLPAQGRSP
jgi:protein TonB